MYSKNFKPVSYKRSEIEDMRIAAEQERVQFAQEDAEQEAAEALLTVSWTSQSGVQIAVRYEPSDEEYFVTVKGQTKRVVEIAPVRNMPGVVAKLVCPGFDIGLTAERLTAVKGLAN